MENIRKAMMPMRFFVQDYDPAAQSRMKADSYNAAEGSEPGLDCQVCRNKRVIAYPKDDGSGNIYTRPCKCAEASRCVQRMERSGLRDVIKTYTFARFQATAAWQETAKGMAEAYAAEPKGWFLVCGQSGSGKTHLCTAICRELLLQRKGVSYMPWRQDIAELKAVSMEPERRKRLMDELKQAEFLYIDDLFKTGANADGLVRPTSADISLAFELLNHRYINRLPTILSTELLPEELMKLDEATGGRILEMAGSNTVAIRKDPAKNYRMHSLVRL